MFWMEEQQIHNNCPSRVPQRISKRLHVWYMLIPIPVVNFEKINPFLCHVSHFSCIVHRERNIPTEFINIPSIPYGALGLEGSTPKWLATVGVHKYTGKLYVHNYMLSIVAKIRACLIPSTIVSPSSPKTNWHIKSMKQ